MRWSLWCEKEILCLVMLFSFFGTNNHGFNRSHQNDHQKESHHRRQCLFCNGFGSLERLGQHKLLLFLKVSLKSFDDLTLALLDSFWTSFEICWQVILWVSDWDNDDPNWMCLCRLVLLTTFLQLPSTVSLICFLFAQNGIALLCWFCDDRQYEAWQIACQCLEWQIRDVSWVQQIRWYSSQGDLGLSRVCVETREVFGRKCLLRWCKKRSVQT